MKNYKFPSTWHKMRELVILSINLIYVKDLLQMDDRISSKSIYLDIPNGSIKVHIDALQARKKELNKRIKDLLEYILNETPGGNRDSVFVFNIDEEAAGLTRKQLEKGYALFTNVKNDTYALNLRTGGLLIINTPELNASDRNLMSLEYTAQHDGTVYGYFEIDQTDPLKDKIRY
jgi:hypothetical protein